VDSHISFWPGDCSFNIIIGSLPLSFPNEVKIAGIPEGNFYFHTRVFNSYPFPLNHAKIYPDHKNAFIQKYFNKQKRGEI
jgi:hypothetical protein